MKTVIGAMMYVAGVVGVAHAADTTIKYEVSTDGLNWSTSLNALPGTQIQVRTRVIWTGATQVYGLEQVTFQPIVSNWTAADHLETTAGTPVNPNNALNPSGNGPGGVGILGGAGTNPSANVPDTPGVWGRVSPFAFVATTTSSYLRGFLGTGTAAGLLRIALSQTTNWIGQGPTSGMGSANNWSAGNGVIAGQLYPEISSPRPGGLEFVPGTDYVVFKFGFTLSAAASARTLSIDTPLSGIRRETHVGPNYGRSVVYWAVTPTDALRPFYDSIAAAPAFVNVVPAPGASLLVVAIGSLAARRRR
ncbi:MAG: hypothetical protein GC200_08905 [Tepidisphaera sp.]|nr:hypothetical protein [Tepidisphaera sp.]